MCGLFGFINYSGGEINGLSDLTKSLAEESAVRGTDATGIAFGGNKGICVLKEAKPASQFKIKHSDDIVALIGHTRHGTQGSEKKNYNNHPFLGQVRHERFALAHNGVLTSNERQRKKLGLPKTKIETDSYQAVQLIEKKNRLNFDSLKYMAETVDGSFSFTVLDDKNNVYFVKGDSPLTILHFPKLKLYVYASTDEILYRALVDSPLFGALRRWEYEEVEIQEGDILKISAKGRIEKDEFEYSYYQGLNWWDYGCYCYGRETEDEYVEGLKSVAAYMGYEPEIIDRLLAEGFSTLEVEEYIYGNYEEW